MRLGIFLLFHILRAHGGIVLVYEEVIDQGCDIGYNRVTTGAVDISLFNTAEFWPGKYEEVINQRRYITDIRVFNSRTIDITRWTDTAAVANIADTVIVSWKN